MFQPPLKKPLGNPASSSESAASKQARYHLGTHNDAAGRLGVHTYHTIPYHCIALHYITLHTYIYIYIHILYIYIYTQIEIEIEIGVEVEVDVHIYIYICKMEHYVCEMA